MVPESPEAVLAVLVDAAAVAATGAEGKSEYDRRQCKSVKKHVMEMNAQLLAW
jgi:hypothetical protein